MFIVFKTEGACFNTEDISSIEIVKRDEEAQEVDLKISKISHGSHSIVTNVPAQEYEEILDQLKMSMFVNTSPQLMARLK